MHYSSEFYTGLGDPRSYRERQLIFARALLKPGEIAVPPTVREIASLLTQIGIWFQLSRNARSESCAEAAHNRTYLGTTGILLAQELKTGLWRGRRKNNEDVVIMTHTRGDKGVDVGKLVSALDLQPGSVTYLEDEGLDQLGLAHGLVYPLTGARLIRDKTGPKMKSPYVQVVDEDVMRPLTKNPSTVMTNAGNYTWGLEVNPREFFGKIAGVKVAPIAGPVEKDAPPSPEKHLRAKIAVITGNPPESGALLHQLINDHTREILRKQGVEPRDTYLPRVFVCSIPEMGDSIENDRRAPLVSEGLTREISEMMVFKPDIIVLACNTTPIYAEQIRRGVLADSSTRLVTLPEATTQYLVAKGIDRVALFGIPEVAGDEDSPYLRGFHASGIYVESLKPEVLERIRDIAHIVKREGTVSHAITLMRDILCHEKYKPQAEWVIVALTEISQLVLKMPKVIKSSGKVLIDPLDLTAEYIARWRLGFPFPTGA